MPDSQSKNMERALGLLKNARANEHKALPPSGFGAGHDLKMMDQQREAVMQMRMEAVVYAVAASLESKAPWWKRAFR